MVMSIRDKIEVFVKAELGSYKPLHIRAPKVIHDTILGSNLFYPHEIAILDLPIIQRLRRINQVDVVSLVFPSGNHNRFEHTLGVTVIADKLARSIKAKYDESEKTKERKFLGIMTDKDIVNIRLAAIMHDCGHGPFSHISEDVYKNCSDLAEEIKSNERLQGSSPHEALSYLIVTSKAFKDFITENIVDKYHVDFDLNLIGDMIVGYVEDPKKAYLIDVINGAFDADKLDYIQRDSHFTGIKMVLDLDRLFYTIDVIEDEYKRLRLSVDMSGVSTLEQIVFNKMMLFSVVYHHHKVRAAECLFRSIFEEIKKCMVPINGFSFESAVDFLYLTDIDIFSLSKRPELGRVATLAHDLCFRNLPKRAMVLSHKTVTKETSKELGNVMQLYERPDWEYSLREAIAETACTKGHAISANDIWIDMPRGPSFKEGVEWPIKSLGTDKGFIQLRDVIPVDDWVKAFEENKWKGYVFSLPELQSVVYEATKTALYDIYNLEVNKFARLYCKIDVGDQDTISSVEVPAVIVSDAPLD